MTREGFEQNPQTPASLRLCVITSTQHFAQQRRIPLVLTAEMLYSHSQAASAAASMGAAVRMGPCPTQARRLCESARKSG